MVRSMLLWIRRSGLFLVWESASGAAPALPIIVDCYNVSAASAISNYTSGTSSGAISRDAAAVQRLLFGQIRGKRIGTVGLD